MSEMGLTFFWIGVSGGGGELFPVYFDCFNFAKTLNDVLSEFHNFTWCEIM